MTEINVTIHKETDRTFGKEDINKIRMKHCNEKLAKAGHVSLNLDDQLNPSMLHISTLHCKRIVSKACVTVS